MADPIITTNNLPARTDVNLKKKTNTEFFTKNSIGIESYANKDGYNGLSLRCNTAAVTGNWGSIKIMPMVNLNKDGDASPNLRLTTSSPSITLGKVGNTTFSGAIENRTTLKFDNKFHKTDLVQEPRGIFEAKNGDWTASVIPRAKISEQDSKLKFNGGVLTLQKKCGKINPYFETYLPREVFTKGDLKTTNFAFGLSYKF